MADLTTVEAARKFGFFKSSEDDSLLAALIAAASEGIEAKCGRRFRVDTASVHTFTARNLPLPYGTRSPFNGPVLLLDEELAAAASAITGSPTVSYLPENGGPPYHAIINEDSYWTSPISVTGLWGYSEMPPPNVELACLRLTKWAYELRSTTRGDSVVVTDQGAVLLPAQFPSDVLALLSPYIKQRHAG
jgi:hypothetical protein